MNNDQAIQGLYNQIKTNGAGQYTFSYEGHVYTMYVGADALNDDNTIKESTSIVFHNPGSSGDGDLNYLVPGVSSLDQDTIEIAYYRKNDPNGYDPYAYGFVDTPVNLMNDITSGFSTSKNGAVFTGYSDTDATAFKQALNYIDRTNASGTTIISVEPGGEHGQVYLNQDQINLLNETNTVIVDIHNADMSINNGSNNGLHYYEVIVDNYHDAEHTQKAQAAHGYAYQLFGSQDLGDIDWENLPDSFITSDGKFYFDYKVIEHNADGSTRTVSLEELNSITSGGDKVLSDVEYVFSKAKDILSNIANSSLLEQKNVSLGDSTTKSPQINIDIYNKLCTGIKELSSKLYGEANAIVNIAKHYDELDYRLKYKALAENANELGSFKKDTVSPMYNVKPISSTSTGKMKDSPNEKWNDFNWVATQKDMTNSLYEVTADDLNRLFQHWADERNNTDSPLLGKGEYFIKAAETYGLDVMTLVSICGKETGYGCSPDAYPRMNNHNFFGQDYTYDKNGQEQYWGARNQLYDTDEEGIIAGARRIKEFYYDEKGYKTFQNLGYGGYAAGGNEQYRDGLTYIYQDSMDYILKTDPLNPENEGKDLSTTPRTNRKPSSGTSTSSETGSGSSSYSGSNSGTTSYSGSNSGTSSYSGTNLETTSTSGTSSETTPTSETSSETTSTPGTSSETISTSETTSEITPTSGTSSETTSTTGSTSEITPTSETNSNQQQPTERVIERVIEKHIVDHGTGSVQQQPVKEQTTIKPIVEEPINEQITDEPTIETEPTNEQPIEEQSTEVESTSEEPTNEQPTEIPTNNQHKKSNVGKHILTAAGITAAVGGAAGAITYGINQSKKNNEFDESDEFDDEFNEDYDEESNDEFKSEDDEI